ncbi:MAG: PqqD family protein [Rhodothermia bacterium]
MVKSCVRTVDGTSSFEDFDDEIVIIHHESGVFYSLRGRAMALWRACLQGVDSESIEHRLAETDEDEATIIRAMISEFTTKGILGQTDSNDNLHEIADWSNLDPAQFERNEDFDDLIKLDPIHDVDERGWPHKARDSS